MPKHFRYIFILFFLPAACHACLAQTTPNAGKAGAANSDPAAIGYSWAFDGFPDVRNPTRSAGRVVINISIDTAGHITRAEADPRRTTIKDSLLIKLCENAVKNAKLKKVKPGSPEASLPVQNSQIVFVFKVD